MEEEKKEAVNEEPSHEPEKGIDEREEDKNAIALFSYLGIFIIIPLLTDKDNPFVKFHIKQGLVFLIFAVLLGWIPFLGWIAVIILGILGIVNVLNGNKKELPVIGQFGKKFNF